MSIPIKTKKFIRGQQAEAVLLDRDGCLDAEAVITRSYESLERMRLTAPRRPFGREGEGDIPEFPSDLSSTDGGNLGYLLGYYTSMADYANANLAEMDAKYTINEYNDKMARLMHSLQSQGSIKDRDALGFTHPITRKKSIAHMQAMAEFKLTKAYAEGYTNKAKAISREISRRTELQRLREA